jgi:DnaJ family protein A protein 3
MLAAVASSPWTPRATCTAPWTTDKFAPPRRHLHTSRVAAAATSNKSYYEVLGVPRDASAKDIKKAYYQLAKKYHPDTNKGDKDAQRKFQEVSEAYECLSDDTKRKQYDAFGSGAFSGGGGGGGGPADGFGGAWNFRSSIDPEELFKTIFGDQSWRTAGGGGGAGAFGETHFDFGGAPQQYQLNLTFSEAARGVNKEMTVVMADTCSSCGGDGAKPGTKPERCPQCHGTGMETISTGPFMMRSTCRRCHGRGTWMFNISTFITATFEPCVNCSFHADLFSSGSWVKDPCGDCRGSGQTRQRKTAVVPVPAGVEDGQTVRVAVGRREVFVTFKVAKSDYFKRHVSLSSFSARSS